MKRARHPASTALQALEPAAAEIYSIEAVAQLTQIPRHQIAVYCRHGLVAPVTLPELQGWWFDYEAIRVLRQLEWLRGHCAMNFAGLSLMANLSREVDRLREEVRALRRA